MTVPTWWSEGYTPKYKFAYSGIEGDTRLYDVTGRGTGFTGQDLYTQANPALYDARNTDPQYQFDYQKFLTASSGEPGTGWALGDNAGQGESFWSWLAGNNATIPLLVTGALAGAAGGAGAAAQAASTGGGALATLAANPSTYWSALQGIEGIAGDPGGASVGGALGSLGGSALGAYLGVPGGSLAGGLLGKTVGGEVAPTDVGVTRQSQEGGQAVADANISDTPADNVQGQTDWAKLLTSILGLGGAGLGLAGNISQSNQGTALYELLLKLAQQFQQEQNTFNQSNKDSDQRHQEERAQYQSALEAHNAATQQIDQRREGETEQDFANRQATLQARNGIAGNLSDPAKVAAGGQALYQPLSENVQDRIGRDTYRQLAARGVTDGGAASLTLNEAFAPYETQLQQFALQQYLASQSQALNGYSYAPAGELTPLPTAPLNAGYTPGPTAPATALGNFPGAPSTYQPQPGAQKDLLSSLGPLAGGLLQALGLSVPEQLTPYQKAILQALGIGGKTATGQPSAGLDGGPEVTTEQGTGPGTTDLSNLTFNDTVQPIDWSQYGDLLGNING